MKTTFLMAAAVAALPMAANAYLRVSGTSSDLGKNCYTEDDSKAANIGRHILAAQEGPSGYFVKSSLPSDEKCSSSLSSHDVCWIDVVGNTIYYCLKTIPAMNNNCPQLSPAWSPGSMAYKSDFFSCSSNSNNPLYCKNIELKLTYVTNWSCKGEYYGGTYGCGSDYYISSGSGLNSICSKCPTSGGVAGKSDFGNSSITGCYIPDGSKFSDSTGSGTIQGGKCYWKN